MAGYGAFQRARKSFGSRRGMRRSNSSRGSRYGYKKMGSTIKPRFATVGFARNVERKYFDKTYASNFLESFSGANSQSLANGVTYISNTWSNYPFGSLATPVAISNDMFKGLATGTDARSRIGNKVKPNYLKGAFTMTAASINAATTKSQNGEAPVLPTGSVTLNYLRTTYRFMIVKDLQVNSTDTQVTWSQVMDTTGLQAGVHSELNVDNMGRFIVLEDKIFVVDGDNPQKTCPWQISGSRVGPVRYNGPGATALTDKGLYVVWAAFVMGAEGNLITAADINLPTPVGHSRLCFTDD